jgi:hypothetical protein
MDKDFDANPALANQAREDGLGPTGFDRGDGPYTSQAEAWNEALENAAQIVEKYNAAFAEPECGCAPGDIRALKRAAPAKARGVT